MKKYFTSVVLLLILITAFFSLNELTAKTELPKAETNIQEAEIKKEGVEIGVYNAELTKVIENPAAPLAANIYVDLPAGSCIDFKYINPNSLNETLLSGCNADRKNPLPNISEIQMSGKRINVFGNYDYTDCQSIPNECVINLMINKIEIN